MNLNQFKPRSAWSAASGAESLLLRHVVPLRGASPSSDSLIEVSNRDAEPRRFSGGLDLSKGGGSCSRQLKTFSGLMRTQWW